MSDGGEEGEGSPEARGLAAAAPASGAGSFGAAPEAPDALLAGQMTSDAPLLQLEVSELLCDVRLDYSALGDVEAALGQLRRALAALPEAQVRPCCCYRGCCAQEGALFAAVVMFSQICLQVVCGISLAMPARHSCYTATLFEY